MSNMPALRPGGGSRLYPISRLQSPGTISVVRSCKVGVARAVCARVGPRVLFVIVMSSASASTHTSPRPSGPASCEAVGSAGVRPSGSPLEATSGPVAGNSTGEGTSPSPAIPKPTSSPSEKLVEITQTVVTRECADVLNMTLNRCLSAVFYSILGIG